MLSLQTNEKFFAAEHGHTDLPIVIGSGEHDGFALVDEELELGLRSIAVAVKNRQNETVAAMNIGVHAVRITAKEMIERLLPILLENARLLSQCLG